MNNLAEVYRAQGKLAEAATLHTQVLDTRKRVLGQEHSDTLASMQGLARLLATADDATVRNGPEALKLATAACAANDWKEPNFVDTLAAAHAELDQWNQAIAMEQKAISLLSAEQKKDSKRLEGFQARLHQYEKHEKFREEARR